MFFTPFAFVQQPYAVSVIPSVTFQGYYIGGNFTAYASSLQPYFRMLDSSGSTSSSFNIGAGFGNSVYGFATQSDGKIVATGTFTSYSGSASNRIVRLNTNGTRDTTFVLGNGLSSLGYSVAVQSDGKIVVAGAFATYSGSGATRIARINTNGTIDSGSSWNTGAGFDNSVLSLAIQSDQKIIAGGSYVNYSGSAKNNIVRINTDGTADTGSSWNQGTGCNSAVNSVAVQSDGKIILVGGFTSYSGSGSNRIVRLNTNGTKDTTFNIGAAGLDNTAFAVAVQPDGKIVVGGTFTSYSGSVANDIVRINVSGTLDTTFNTGRGFDGTVYGLAVQPDGKIVVQGIFSSYSGSVVGGLVRLNSSGSLDTTFNSNMTVNSAQQNSPVLALSNGSVLVGGAYTAYRDAWANFLDSSGSITSKSSISKYFNGTVSAMISQSDGKLLVGGGFTNYSGSTANYLTRINTNGTIDSSSSWNIGTGFNSTVFSMATQSDGKLIAGGAFTTYSGSSSVNRIVRLNTNGARDTTFNPGTAGANGNVNSIVVQPDGKIVLAGAFISYSGSTKNYIVRTNTDGTADTGSSWNTGTGFSATTNLLLQQPDGKIVVGGQYATYSGSTKNSIARLNTDGTSDTGSSWNTGTGFSPVGVPAGALQSDGKIVLGGNFTSYSGSSINRIARLNTSGTLDTTLVTGTGFNGAPAAIAIEPGTGKILVGGAFTSYSGSTVTRIARLNTNGTLDTTFTPVSGGFSGNVNVLITY